MKWHEVTWYSRLGALILFVGVVPALSFYFGMQYERVMEIQAQNDNMVMLFQHLGSLRGTTTTATHTTDMTGATGTVETGGDTTNNGNTTPSDSGVRGVVMLGPTCPVVHIPPKEECADKPYATTITVSSGDDPTTVLFMTKSDANGRFAVTLVPGDYVLRAGEGARLPYCQSEKVTVPADQYATTTLSCDTGIR